MIDDVMKEHYLKTAENYFLVEVFLARPESQELGPLARLALTLIVEPNPYITAKQLAGQMGVSETYAKAALEELLSAGHVYRTTYVNESWYRFTPERIDFENRSRAESAARTSTDCEKASTDW
jgi:Fic family protein